METPTPTADHDLLIEVNTNVKNLTSSMQAYTSATNQVTQDHEHRIRTLESESQQMKGAQKSQKNTMTVISFVGGIISAVIGVILFLQGTH